MLLRNWLACALCVFLAAAQSTAPQAFEVASIKPNASTDNRVSIRMAPGGRFTATGITLKQLMSQAFNVRDFQISGGPGWISAERYDINAKGPDGMADRMPPEVLRPMLRALIEERFQLKSHTESKEMPIYVLVVGKNGSKLTASTEGQGPGMRLGRGLLNGKQISMAMLAQHLGQQTGRKVVDKTGLTGDYDMNLEWTPEPGQGAGGPFAGPPGAGNPLPAADSNGPTIYTALQEQLGLKLESEKGPVDVIVIDSVSKPTDN